MFPKIVGFPPKSSIFNRVFHYKPSILGYPCSWKHPYSTLPETNSSPLTLGVWETIPFFLGWPIFRGHPSLGEGKHTERWVQLLYIMCRFKHMYIDKHVVSNKHLVSFKWFMLWFLLPPWFTCLLKLPEGPLTSMTFIEIKITTPNYRSNHHHGSGKRSSTTLVL